MFPLIELITQAVALANEAIPGKEQRLEFARRHAPVQTERFENKLIEIRLRRLRKLHRFMDKHNLTTEQLLPYVKGDTATANVLNAMRDNRNK